MAIQIEYTNKYNGETGKKYARISNVKFDGDCMVIGVNVSIYESEETRNNGNTPIDIIEWYFDSPQKIKDTDFRGEIYNQLKKPRILKTIDVPAHIIEVNGELKSVPETYKDANVNIFSNGIDV